MALPFQIEVESITLNFTGGLPQMVAMHGRTTTNELALLCAETNDLLAIRVCEGVANCFSVRTVSSY